VHAVDEMRPGIRQGFALLGDVEIPDRPPVGTPATVFNS
jgi:hypothetical protein